MKKYKMSCFFILFIIMLAIPIVIYANLSFLNQNYYISGEYIIRIKPETTVEDFFNNLESNTGETLKLYDNGREVASTEYIKTGMELRYGSNAPYVLVVQGDINSDGKVTPTDLSKLKQYRVGLINLEGAELRAADINYNGEVTILDISQLKMLLVGLDIEENEMSTGNIIVTQNTTDPTKEVILRIEVKEDANIDYDKMKVSLDNGVTWEICTGEVKLTDNKEVRIRLVKEHSYEVLEDNIEYKTEIDPNTGEESLIVDYKYYPLANETDEEYRERMIALGVMKKEIVTEDMIVEEYTYIVNNIDNLKPDVFEFTATTTTNSITVEAATIDKLKDYEGNIVQNTYSGVKTYEYRINDGAWQKSNEFINLTKNTEYRVYVRATDYAGNITEATNSGTIVKTNNIEIPNLNIEFETSETDVTNEDVAVTMECKELEGTEFKIQYQIDGTDGVWQNGSKYLAK